MITTSSFQYPVTDTHSIHLFFKVIYSFDRHNRTPLHVLLCSKDTTSHIPISNQVNTTLSVSNNTFPIHLALKFGASIETLNALIALDSSHLVKKSEHGCTPLHYVFLISDKIRPTIAMIKSLLTTPGENAARLKDSEDRLPLHIAAERGAEAAILELLIEANVDGCYCKNKDGDLPIHLLIRSGNATSSMVEMLLTPMIDSETICQIPGSQGLELPLHIAVEYNCSYKVIESLLLSYGQAALVPRKRSGPNGQPSSQMFALDIFESNRKKEFPNISPITQKSLSSYRSVYSQNSMGTQERVRLDLKKADFDLRSDLIFVYNPITPKIAEVYRKDIVRIERLQSLIRKEAINCAKYRSLDEESNMSEMARLAWSFFCTYENPHDLNDEYSKVVGQILKGLPNPVVQILSDVINPFSSSSEHMPMIDCATTKCKRLLSSRLLFVGRFTLDAMNSVLHKSEDTLILFAKDHGIEEAYRRFISTFKREEEEVKDIDDIASCHSGTIGHMLSFGDDGQTSFVDFATRLGYDEDAASNEYERLIQASYPDKDDSLPEIQAKHERKEMSLELFRQFCDSHGVDSSGIRDVAIKFMKSRCQFLREKVARVRINFSTGKWCALPIIEDYDIDRIEVRQDSSDRIIDVSDSVNIQEMSGFVQRKQDYDDSRDSIYAMDIIESNVSGQHLSSFKYALVLPCGRKNLEEILFHESPDTVEIRNILKKVGNAVKELHDGCKLIYYVNTFMLLQSNILY